MANKRINIDVSFRCNNNCIFCFNPPNNDIVSFDQIKNYLDNNAGGYESTVTISGGEPTLHPDILRIIDYAHKVCKTVGLSTNGRKFSDEKFVTDVAKTGCNNYFIPVHGPNAQIHDSITRVPGSFDETLAGIRNIFRLNNAGNPMNIIIKLLFSKINIKHLPETVRFISETFPRPKYLFIEAIELKKKSPDDRNKLFVTLSGALPYLAEAVQGAVALGHSPSLLHIPPCIFTNPDFYYKYARKFGGVLSYFGPLRQRENILDESVSKASSCSTCEHNHDCSGVLLSYAQMVGFGELKPIKKLKQPAWLAR